MDTVRERGARTAPSSGNRREDGSCTLMAIRRSSLQRSLPDVPEYPDRTPSYSITENQETAYPVPYIEPGLFRGIEGWCAGVHTGDGEGGSRAAGDCEEEGNR